MFAVSPAQFTAEGTADILVHKYIPLWGCPVYLLSDNAKHFCSKLSAAIHKRLGINKLNTSAYHPESNGGTERVNHTMAQMLAVVVNEPQTDWDVQLPHVESAYNNSVNTATGLSPNEVHIGRSPRLPLSHLRQPQHRRPPELGPRPPRVLSPCHRATAARLHHRAGPLRRHRFPAGTPELRSSLPPSNCLISR